MNYNIVGDSLIENYKSENVMCFRGRTLENFLIECDNLLTNLRETYIFSFGANDLSSGIHEDDVIKNYNVLCDKYKGCMIILPPFQSKFFYDKCINNISEEATLILTFISNYTTIDGLHPDERMLDELKLDIEKDDT